MSPLLRCHLLLLLAALACSSATEPSGPVTATAMPAGIRASNHTLRPVFYTAVEREAAALYDPYYCTDESRCSYIVPGASVTMPWSQVASFDPGRHEYLFLWWQAPAPDGSRALTGSVVVYKR